MAPHLKMKSIACRSFVQSFMLLP